MIIDEHAKVRTENRVEPRASRGVEGGEHTQRVAGAQSQRNVSFLPFPGARMGSWLASLQLESLEALGGRGVWPMCYGGAFAASRDGVRQLPRRDWLIG